MGAVYVKCIDVGMASQVKLPKSVYTRSQQSIADTSLANTQRLSYTYLITISPKGSFTAIMPQKQRVKYKTMQVSQQLHCMYLVSVYTVVFGATS